MNNLNDDLINFDEFPNLGNNQNEEDDVFSLIDENINNQNGINDPFEEYNQDNNKVNNDLIISLLNNKGITDPTKIQIEEENGDISEIDFNSLSLDEQLEILRQESDDSSNLDDLEIETINYLRENNITLEELINYQKELAIQEYINSQMELNSDTLSDEELFKLDLKNKYNDLSDDEINYELEKELNNPDIFKKKIDKIRELYKAEELSEKSKLSEQQEKDKQEEYNNTVNLMIEVAQGTDELFDLELEDSDKEEVLQFLLTQDINGQSEFVKMLNDPQQLFNMAWFAIKGKEAFDTIHDYYKKEIDSVRKANKGTNLTSRTTVVKKDTKQGKDDPYDLNKIFNN